MPVAPGVIGDAYLKLNNFHTILVPRNMTNGSSTEKKEKNNVVVRYAGLWTDDKQLCLAGVREP